MLTDTNTTNTTDNATTSVSQPMTFGSQNADLAFKPAKKAKRRVSSTITHAELVVQFADLSDELHSLRDELNSVRGELAIIKQDSTSLKTTVEFQKLEINLLQSVNQNLKASIDNQTLQAKLLPAKSTEVTAPIDQNRLKNVVVSGLSEIETGDQTAVDEHDKNEVEKLFGAIGIDLKFIKSVKRLKRNNGNANPNTAASSTTSSNSSNSTSPNSSSKHTPNSLLLVSLGELISRDTVLDAAKKLKDIRTNDKSLEKVIIRPDLSKAQISDLRDRCNVNNKLEIDKGSSFRWYVRGSNITRFRQNRKKPQVSTA